MKRSVSSTTFVTEGKRNEELINRIDTLEQRVGEGVAFTGNAPQICAGGFYITGAEEKFKKGLRPNFCAEVPVGTVELQTKVIRVADVTDATSYKRKRIADVYPNEDGRT